METIVTGPGRTALARGEFVVAFRLPKPQTRSGDAYLRFIPRTEMDIAVVGCAVNVTLDASGVCTDALVSLGAVAPTQLVVADAGLAAGEARVDRERTARARRNPHGVDVADVTAGGPARGTGGDYRHRSGAHRACTR